VVARRPFRHPEQVIGADVKRLGLAGTTGILEHPGLDAEGIGVAAVVRAEAGADELLEPFRLGESLVMAPGSIELFDVLVDGIEIRTRRRARQRARRQDSDHCEGKSRQPAA
jgi:hypothetical protein